MHLQASLVLAVASSALALPAANQTGPTLAKRYHHGWIGSFDNEQCIGTPIGPRPEIHLGDCTAFTPSPSAAYVGIFWGTGVYDMGRLWIYTDTNCQTLVDTEGGQLTENSDSKTICMRSQDYGASGSVSST